MNTLAKVLLGIGAAAAAVFVVKKATEKKYHTVNTPKQEETKEETNQNETSSEKTEGKRTTSQKFKEKVNDVASDVLLWVATHEKEIKLATVVAGGVGAAIDLATSVKRFRSQNKLEKEVSEIFEKVSAMEKTNPATSDVYKYAYNNGFTDGAVKAQDEILSSIRSALDDGADSISFSDGFGNTILKFGVFEAKENAAA